MRTAVVVNRAAASGRARDVWQRAVASHSDFAAEQVVETDTPDQASERLRACLNDGIERIVVVGGDGTIHLAANEILAGNAGERVVLGIVPAGTGSDLARTLGLARRAEEGLARIRTRPARRIDVLELRTDDGRERYVINVASAGLSGLVDAMVNAMPTRGALAYLQATLRALRQYQPARCRIQVDGAPFFSGAIFLAAIGNGTTFGRGMRITPQARLDDGLADVVVVPAIGTLRVLLRMPQLYRGTHLEHPSVRYVRGREIRFEPIDPLPPFDLDGETFASGAASWRVRPAALTVAG